MKVVLSTLNAKYIHSSLALYYLKAFCDNSDKDIVIKEYSVNNGLLDILSDIYGEHPDVIGLACYIWNAEMTFQLTALIRKVLPDTVIILGGPEVSYGGEAVMRGTPEIDYIIKGEGEEVLGRLLDCLEGQGDVSGIEGLIYRKQDSIIAAGEAQIVADLGLLPFPYRDEDMFLLKDKILYYESSRGCPFSCQYCLSSATSGVRFLPVARVIDELGFFIGHNVRQVKFVDRTFNSRKEHYLPILQFLATAECNTNFHFEIAADILDEETLTVLAAAPRGRFQLEIGVQSTYEPTLKEVRRTNNWPRIVNNVEKLRELDTIHLHLDLIAGLPQESYERFGKSFNDVFGLRPHMLQLGFLKLLKGSGIRNRAASDGYIYMDNAPYEVLANKYISYAEIRALKIMEEVLDQTYNSGRFIRTTDWMIEQLGGAFEFFRDFAIFWEKHKLHTVAHSAKTVYRYYADYSAYKGMDTSLCLQLLKFDALNADGGTIRPEFLPWDTEKWDETKSAFFRNETLAGSYIPGYSFSTWRQVKKQYHIEMFDADVTDPNKTGHKATPILFIYKDHSPCYRKLKRQDLILPEGKGTVDAL